MSPFVVSFVCGSISFSCSNRCRCLHFIGFRYGAIRVLFDTFPVNYSVDGHRKCIRKHRQINIFKSYKTNDTIVFGILERNEFLCRWHMCIFVSLYIVPCSIYSMPYSVYADVIACIKDGESKPMPNDNKQKKKYMNQFNSFLTFVQKKSHNCLYKR